MHSNLAIPDCLTPFAGRIMDADSHEYTPVNHWIEQFGEATRPFVEAHENSKMPIRRFVAADDTPIDDDTIWNTKFAEAPGAFDFQRYAYFQGIGAVGFIYRAPEILAGPEENSWDLFHTNGLPR